MKPELAGRKRSADDLNTPAYPPAASAEAQEAELYYLACQLVRQRLMDGTAKAQETSTIIKMGSIKQQLELEKIRHENELLKAKTDNINASTANRELIENAIAALSSYQTTSSGDEIEDPYIF